MISLLQGTVASQKPDHVVVLVNGVGFKVAVPVNVSAAVGDTITLNTVMIVREDLIALYGFETQEEPRGIPAPDHGQWRGAAHRHRSHWHARHRPAAHCCGHRPGRCALARSGLGRKTSEKIILELRDKLKGGDGLIPAGPLSYVNRDLLDALAGLGYTPAEAQSALNSIPAGADKSFEDRLRLALQYFMRG